MTPLQKLQSKLRRQITKLEAELAPLPGIHPALEKKERLAHAEALKLKLACETYEPLEMRGDRIYHTALVTNDPSRFPEALGCFVLAYSAAEFGGLYEQMKRIGTKVASLEARIRGERR